MKKSSKSALLSAFVFPGVGHFYLRKNITGSTLFGIALIASYYIVSIAVNNALEIVEKIQRGEVQPDITKITELVTNHSSATDSQSLSMSTSVLVICWIIGIIDSYRAGLAEDNNGEK